MDASANWYNRNITQIFDLNPQMVNDHVTLYHIHNSTSRTVHSAGGTLLSCHSTLYEMDIDIDVDIDIDLDPVMARNCRRVDSCARLSKGPRAI